MCGIAGILGNPKPNEIRDILLKLQERGKDATGVSLNCKDTCRIMKAGVEAETFVTLEKVMPNLRRYAGDATVALLHTRAATNGSPSNNHNNHPIWNKTGIIVHNGVSHPKTKYKTVGETDTEEMLECITDKGLRAAIKEITGFFAFAYQEFTDRHIVYLYRHTQPLTLGKKNGNIYFCSTPSILEAAIGEFEKIKVKEHVLYRVNARTGTIQRIAKIKPPVLTWRGSWNGGGYGYGNLYSYGYWRPDATSHQGRFFEEDEVDLEALQQLDPENEDIINQKIQDLNEYLDRDLPDINATAEAESKTEGRSFEELKERWKTAFPKTAKNIGKLRRPLKGVRKW